METTPVLMLSTGYEPLFQTDWKRAIGAIAGGRAEVIAIHEHLTIGTVNGPIPFPVQVRFTSGVVTARIKKFSTAASLTKRNILLRDGGKCQYCSVRITLKTSTIDHVIPKSKGGHHEWCNVVLACPSCNQKKGNKLLSEFNLKLLSRPRAPTLLEILNTPLH